MYKRDVQTSTLAVSTERILEEARLKVAIAREKADDLKRYGITPEWLDELQTDIDTAIAYPTYEQQRNELRELTAIKDSKLNECVGWGRELRFRMSLAFKQRKHSGMQFPTKEWSQAEKNESRLIALFPTLLQLARSQATTLATLGQTEDDIATGERLLQELIKANQAQEEYQLKRTSITAQRRSAYRRLYDGVNRINHTGQMVYSNDTPNGRLFRSNWQFHRNGNPHPDSEIKTLEAIALGEEE